LQPSAARRLAIGGRAGTTEITKKKKRKGERGKSVASELSYSARRGKGDGGVLRRGGTC